MTPTPPSQQKTGRRGSRAPSIQRLAQARCQSPVLRTQCRAPALSTRPVPGLLPSLQWTVPQCGVVVGA